MKDTVTLKTTAKGKSLRFVISPAVRESLNIEFGEPLTLSIYGIFKESSEMVPVDPPIPMPSKVNRAGGSTSAGITVRKDITKLLNLKAGYMLVLNIEKIEKV
ncbi:MAG: hypothetical protein KJI71_00510 [Patescibacteria group bacterium]|nr:hypothetical protein [Patescibacteria group bacterium]